jgi:hypothetical protein
MTRPFKILGALLLSCGCSSLDNCPDGRDPILVAADAAKTDVERLAYESAPWGGTLTYFPAKTEVWFEHGMGVIPLDITPYLSFSHVGTADKEGGSVTQSAGNQSLIDCVDARYIVLRNDTCESSFYVRVTAHGQALNPDPDALEACGEMP